MNKQIVDDLSDVIIEIESHPTDGPNALPKNADGTPNISHKETVDAAQKAREEAERVAGEAFSRERQQLQSRIDSERRERERVQREADERVEAERQARNAAEQRGEENKDLAMRAHWASLQTRKESFESGVATMEAHIESLQSQIAKASEADDHQMVAKLTRDMATATNAKGTYEQALHRVGGEIERAKHAFEQADATRTEPEPKTPEKKEPEKKTFNLDEWIDGCPSSTQPWLRDNREKLQDPKYLDRVNTFARMYVLDNGGDPNSLGTPEFLEAMKEKFEGKKQTKKEDTTMATDEEEPGQQQEPAKEPAKRQGTHAAPVSRSQPGQPGSNGAIRLTQDQYNIAPQLYPTYDDLDPDARAKFPQWSETAARWQYDRHLKRAQASGKFK